MPNGKVKEASRNFDGFFVIWLVTKIFRNNHRVESRQEKEKQKWINN